MSFSKLRWVMAWWIGVFLVTAGRAADLPRLSSERIAVLQERFGGVKAWRITYRYTGDNPHQWTEGGTRHLRVRWNETSQGAFILPTTERDPLRLRVEGRGASFDSIDCYRVSRSSPVHQETRYDRGAGATQVHVDVTIDFETGTYDVAFLAQEFPASYGGTMKDAFHTRRYAAEANTHVVMPIPAPGDVTLRLPEEGTAITGSWSHEAQMAANRRRNPGFDEAEYAEKSPTRGELVWTIEPAEVDPLDVELLVEPTGYADWMPQAGAHEKTAGNQIAIQAALVAKNGGPLSTRHADHVFPRRGLA